MIHIKTAIHGAVPREHGDGLALHEKSPAAHLARHVLQRAGRRTRHVQVLHTTHAPHSDAHSGHKPTARSESTQREGAEGKSERSTWLPRKRTRLSSPPFVPGQATTR